MRVMIIPAQPRPSELVPAGHQLVGRDPDCLTATEERIAEHLGLHGELYWAEYAVTSDYIYLRTDGGLPGEYIDCRVPPDTPLREAAWRLAEVADYYLNTMA